MDCRKHNAVAFKNAYPIPRLEVFLESLGKACIFSMLEASSAYWEIEFDDWYTGQTIFTSNHGLYRFSRMLLGLENAPSTFQRTMDAVLSTVKWQFCACIPGRRNLFWDAKCRCGPRIDCAGTTVQCECIIENKTTFSSSGTLSTICLTKYSLTTLSYNEGSDQHFSPTT